MLATKEDLTGYATKEDLNKAVGTIITAIDSFAKKVDTVETEQVANVAAHDRFEERIIKLEARPLAS